MGVTNTVGFVIGDLTNPFYSLVAAGVERVLAREGMTLVIAASDDESRLEPTVVSAMLERRIRGLLLVPIADDHSYLDGERHFGTPIVAVDRPLSNATSDSVVLDNRAGAQGRGARAPGRRAHPGGVRRERRLALHPPRATARLPRRPRGSRPRRVDPALIRTDGPDIASAAAAVSALLDSDARADGGLRGQQPGDDRRAAGHPAARRPASACSASTTSSSPGSWA